MKKAKHYFRKLVLSHASPEEVAQGFSLGIFIAMTPTLGLQMFIAVTLAALLKKNELAAILGVWVTNPLTAFPIYLGIYKFGQWILRIPVTNFHQDSLTDIFHMSADLIRPLLVGGILIGIVSAVISYFVVKYTYPYLKKKEEQLKEKLSQK